MMPKSTAPELRPFDGSKIPQTLKSERRWAPWKAVFNEKRQKFDKIPHQAQAPFYGISTAKPERWYSYEQALKAYQDNPTLFAGVGYVMTRPHGIVGIDLDNCVQDNTIAPWALEVIEALGSYTEISPSGHGLRILAAGEIANDWTNHETGIEVYGGNEPRFLTVTGQRLKTSAHQVLAPEAGALAALDARYAKTKSTATIISLHLPELIDELLLPDLASLELPYQARDFLESGEHRGDRSRELFASAVALYAAGLSDDQVFSLLASSPHAFDVAMDHRRNDSDRALMYLWVEHCQKAKGRATSKLATLADFEDVSPVAATPRSVIDPTAAFSIDDFDDVSEPNAALAHAGQAQAATKSVAKPMRFAFSQAAEYLKRKPVSWLIKKVLPHGDVGAVFGESGAGKSFLALDLVMAIAAGTPWKGHEVSQGTVAYVCAEGAGGFTVRLRAYAEHHGIDLALLPIHILGDAPNFLEKQDIKDLLAALRMLPGLKVIVVDTLAQVTAGGNENSGEDMGRALAHCKALSKGTGAMVLLVAHSGKDSTRGLRGWSGIKGALDVEILVERSDKYRSATITKMKDGEGEGEEFAFSLTSVTVGQDEDGDDVTSCVIQHGANVSKADRKTPPKGNVEKVVLRVAVDLTDLPGAVTAAQLVDAVINELPKPEDKRDQRRRDAMRALESLVANNHLSLAGGEVVVL
jgi:hypothetical protein